MHVERGPTLSVNLEKMYDPRHIIKVACPYLLSESGGVGQISHFCDPVPVTVNGG